MNLSNHVRLLLIGVIFLVSTPLQGQIRTSVQTGDWTDVNTWDCGCVPAAGEDAVIAAGHTVKLTTGGGGTFITNFTIDASGVLNTDNKKFTISGNVLINGSYASSAGAQDMVLIGGGTTLGGTGVINIQNQKLDFQGDVSIISTAELTVLGKGQLENGVTVTNNGLISFNNDVDGKNAASTWINAANSTLKSEGKIMDTGVLVANATGNEVEYFKKGNADITTPVPATYYHLTISGTDDKKILTDLTIDGDLTVNSGIFDCNNFNINIRGDWNNFADFDERTAVVTFDGAGAQNIYGLFGETFYDLAFTRTAGSCDMTIEGNITISNNLIMNSGNITTGDYRLILGTGTGNEGTLTHGSGTIVGEFERWIDNASTGTGYLFPVGTCSNYLPATPTFNMITGLGGTLIGKFIEADPTNNGLPLEDLPDSVFNTFAEGYWSLEEANGFNSTNYDLDLTGNGFTSFTINGATRILTRPDAATNWTAEGTHAAAVAPTASRTGIGILSAQYVFADTTDCSAPTTSAITGNTDVCTSETGVSYSVTNSPGSTYTWTITGGTQASGGTTNSITVDWGATGMSGSVQVVENNGCTNGYPVTLTTNVHSKAPSGITGKTAVGQFITGEVYSITGAEPGYTYTWTVTGGTITSGQGTSSITVDWGAAGSGQVCATGDNGSCGASSSTCINVKIYLVIESAQTGDWDVATTWDCVCIPQATDNVRILNTHTVSLTQDETINHITINAGGVVDAQVNNKRLTVTGDIMVNGDYLGDGKELVLEGVNTTIDGSGTIAITGGGDLEIHLGNKTILSTALLTLSAGDFNIKDASLLITNNGSITIADNLKAKDNTNTWNNTANSTLNVGLDLLGGGIGGNGTLLASATGNTVHYNGTVNQDIKDPSGSTYYNLTTSGSGVKEMFAFVDINGNLLIDGTCQLDCGNFNINLAGNWTNTSGNADPFVQQTATVTMNGTSDQLITNVSDEFYYDLVINKASGEVDLAAATDIQIANLLTLTSGIIDSRTNNSLVIIPAGANSTSGNSSSYVVGKMQKTGTSAFVFPMGDGTVWARIGISAPTIGSTFEAEYFDASYADVVNVGTLNNVSVVEHWILDRAVGTDNVAVTLYWEDGVRSGINNMTDLVVARYNGANWVDETQLGGTTGTVAAGTVTSQAIATFSPFTFGSGAPLTNPLPIELISFDAHVNGDQVDLKWVTATEINNASFTVQKTKDGIRFEDVLTVPGALNSTSIIEYFDVDHDPYTGVSYYRLKQTDLNGDTTVSNLVPVEYNPANNGLMSIFPNPSDGSNINVSLSGLDGKEVLVALRSLTGAEIWTKVVIVKSDEEVYAMDPQHELAPGIYLITASSNNLLYSKKLVIQK